MANEIIQPNFIDRDPETILNEWVSDYEARTGRVLQPAQPERLIIQAAAYREVLLRSAIQEIALQNLVSFASGSMLDNLGELVGVRRLAPAPATTVLSFSIVNGHQGVIIPQGTRVATVDGLVVFTTDIQIAVAEGVFGANVEATASEVGSIGNNYITGQVIELLDPKPYITAVTNITTTSRGAEVETDEALRGRIKIAPETFSTAGSRGSYEFHAKSASALIIDVAITSPIPGTVEIYPLIYGGVETPSEILSAVAEICSGDKVRPLTDTVLVKTPEMVEYSIEVELELYGTADATKTLEAAQISIDSFVKNKASQLGQDIVLSQIIAAASVDGVYKVNVVTPEEDLIIGTTNVAVSTSRSIVLVGNNIG